MDLHGQQAGSPAVIKGEASTGDTHARQDETAHWWFLI
jgi:hypothetical protein